MIDFGIRREDKNRWERRAPLTPLHVRELVRDHGRRVAVQPSPLRVYADDEYRAAGALVTDDLSDCRVILGVKEIPPDRLVPGRPHLFFSHVIKGQRYNMPLLQRLLDLRCTLIDYEIIVDREGQRLIFFGRHAGYAGMIDALWAVGQRMAARGVGTAFGGMRPAHAYPKLAEATGQLAGEIADRIRDRGIRPELHPLVIGFTGGGNVSQGAQQILDHLPVVEVTPDDLPSLGSRRTLSRHAVYKVVFRGHHRDRFARHLPFLTVLVNGIYWEPGMPRLVTREALAALWAGGQAKLQVIADISCDVDGSVEATVRHSTPDDPAYVYEPATGDVRPGVRGEGPVILAVDNLPAEIPRDASDHFGDSLFPFADMLAEADFSQPLEGLALPAALRGAIVCHQGELAPKYRHLAAALEAAPR